MKPTINCYFKQSNTLCLLLINSPKKHTVHLFFLALSLFSLVSCNEDVPVHLNGKVVHAITGDNLSDIDVRIENIVCSGFSPAVCNHIRLKETTNSKGEFSFTYFQDCETEIFATATNDEEVGKHKKFIYKEVAGRDDDLSCNDRPIIEGDDGYYFELTLQPQLYVDIYAVDDPNIELSSFLFNGEKLDIIKSSHFQKRYKIDLTAYRGELTFTSNYRNPDSTKEVVSYDYQKSDEVVYEVRY
jgi:hypothetical protein